MDDMAERATETGERGRERETEEGGREECIYNS